MAVATVLALIYVRKLSEPYLILLAAVIGVALKTLVA
jgi:hypothetical protein